MSRLRIVASLVLLAAAGSCSNLAEPMRDLDAARARWSRWGPASYDLTVQISCFCLNTSPVLSQVRNGVIVAQFDANTGQSIGPPFRSPGTVDALFDLLEQSASANPDRMDVEYDPATGYPTRGNVDARLQTADDEYTFTAVLTQK